MRKWFYLALLLALFGCEKDLQFENLDFEPKLVINGFTSTDSIMNIGLSKSTSTLTEPSLKLVQGKVKILVLKDNLLLLSDSLQLIDGTIPLPYKPLEGSTYEIQVGYGNLPTVKAIDKAPLSRPDVRIDTILSEGENYRIILRIRDKVDSNRYAINLNLSGKELVGTDSVMKKYPTAFTSTDKIFLSTIRTFSNGSKLAIFNDETWNGTERKIELLLNKSLLEYPEFKAEYVEIDLKDLSKTMYDYYIEVNSNTHVYGGPLASVSRVVGNVEQGLGAFCFYTETVKELKLPKN